MKELPTDQTAPKKSPLEDIFKDIKVPSTPEEIANLIEQVLGQKSTCIKNPVLSLNRVHLLRAIEALTPEERKRLIKYVSFFQLYMSPLLLFSEEKRGKAMGFYENIIRSSLALHVIFSIIEERTRTSSKDFTQYLKENMDKLTKPSDIDDLAKQHREEFPKNVSRIRKFYSEFLSEKEKEDLIKDYKSKEVKTKGKSYKNLDAIIDDIYGSMRSGFSHSLGIDHLRKDNYILVWEGEIEDSPLIAAYTDLSIDRFLCLSWLGILRSFGYPQ